MTCFRAKEEEYDGEEEEVEEEDEEEACFLPKQILADLTYKCIFYIFLLYSTQNITRMVLRRQTTPPKSKTPSPSHPGTKYP